MIIHNPHSEQWYTEQLLALQEEYPEGSPSATASAIYDWMLEGGVYRFTEDAAFCAMLSDRVFGLPKSPQNLNGFPVRYQKITAAFPYHFIQASEGGYDFADLMPTDIIFICGHVVMVVSVDRVNETVRICENYYRGTINWSREVTKETIESDAQFLLTRFEKVNAAPVPEPEPHDCRIAQFEDMKAYPYGTDLHAAVEWALTHSPQLTAGTDATHFSPDLVVDRVTAMTFLWAAAGKPKPETPESSLPFTDVKPGKWYTRAVLWAYENHITAGKTDGSFGVSDKCTVAHMLTFLYAQQGKPDFDASAVPADYVAEGKYYTKAAKWAFVKRIERGVDGVFHPKLACTRAAAVLYLYRTLEGEAPAQD